MSPGGLFDIPLLEAVRQKSSFETTLCCFNSVSRAGEMASALMLRLGFFVYSTVEQKHLASAKENASFIFE